MSRLQVIALFLLAVLLLGCGGSSSSGNDATGSGRVTTSIEWGARGRAQAPSSALSALLIFQPEDGDPVRFTINRRAGTTDPYTETFRADRAIPAGKYLFSAVFWAEANALGDEVGRAEAPVRVLRNGELANEDGSPFKGLTTVNRIKSVVGVPDQGVGLQNAETVLATAFDSDGRTVVVTSGSKVVTAVKYADRVTINGDQVSGARTGLTFLTVKIDGVTSEPFAFNVSSDGSRVFIFDGSRGVKDITYSEALGEAIMTLAPTNGQAGTLRFRKLPQSLVSGTFGGPANDLGAIAVSADGAFIYAGNNVTGSVEVYDGATRAKVGSWELPTRFSPEQITSIVVNPNDPREIAVTLGNSVYVVQDGVVAPTTAFAQSGCVRYYGDRLAKLDSDGISVYDITESGPELAFVVRSSQFFETGAQMVIDGDIAYCATGDVYDLAAKRRVQKLNVTGQGITYDPASGFLYLLSQADGRCMIYAIATDRWVIESQMEVKPVPNDYLGTSTVMRFGATGLMVRFRASEPLFLSNTIAIRT